MEQIKCKYCDKIIEGFNQKQVKYLMNQHLIARHSDKVEMREKENAKD